jgi:hypothetical protein
MKHLDLSRKSYFGLIGLGLAIAISNVFSNDPALSINTLVDNELNNSIQNQQISTSQTVISNNIVAQAANSTPQEIQDRLAGQWEINGSFSVPITVILTAQGKGFVLLPSGLLFYGGFQSNPIAYEFSYRLGNTNQPIEIDIAQPSEEPIKTIFEFTSDGRLRVELMGIRVGESRPTEFTTGALFLNRVSNLTALPRNTEIANSLEIRIQEKEDEGRNNLHAILRAQQAYFLEKETFTTDIKELGIGRAGNESDNYIYQIRGSLRQSVLVTAIPKIAGVRSFAGVVFVVKQGDTITFKTGVCETIEPSTEPPYSPMLLNSTEIICAAGSRTPEDMAGSRYPGF